MPGNIKQLDEAFEELLNKITFEESDTELTPELRIKRRALADNDDFEFCKIYFPQIFFDLWNAIHRHIKSLKHGKYTVSGSRKFGKTAFTLITKLVKHICLGGIGLTGLILRTQDDAYERGDALMRLIKRNKKLMYDYDVQFQQDKKGHWIVNNKTFVGIGVREGMRNFLDEEFNRFEVLILDDLFNRISVTSKVDNEKVYDFVSSEAIGQMNDDGLLIWLFNIIMPDSPGDKFAKEHPDNHFNLPALNDNEETNWPESKKFTTEYLIALRDSMNYEIWMGDYMNKPVLIGEIFKKEWIRFININTVNIITSLSAIDPSYGKSPEACYKGIITLGVTDKGERPVIDIYLRKEDYSYVFDYIDNIRQTAPHWKILLFENDFSQFQIAKPYYDAWCESHKKEISLFVFSTKSLKTDEYGSDKVSRIMNLVFPHQTGKLLYSDRLEHTADYQLFLTQYLSFGKSTEKLDGLDAEASAYIQIASYVDNGSFNSSGHRKAKEKLFRKV
jgi:hypothetical protein